MIRVDGGKQAIGQLRKGRRMHPIVDVNWAKKHPRAAARIQVAHLLRRVRNQKAARAEKAKRYARLK
jgi:hypothetical protein